MGRLTHKRLRGCLLFVLLYGGLVNTLRFENLMTGQHPSTFLRFPQSCCRHNLAKRDGLSCVFAAAAMAMQADRYLDVLLLFSALVERGAVAAKINKIFARSPVFS